MNFLDVKKRHVRTSRFFWGGQAWLSVDILYTYIIILNNYELTVSLCIFSCICGGWLVAKMLRKEVKPPSFISLESFCRRMYLSSMQYIFRP